MKQLLMASCALLLAMTFACGPTEESIKQEIELARACQADDECVDVGSQCPFGCSIHVNKNKKEHIRSLISAYQKSRIGNTCAYDCLAVKAVKCENNLCKVVFQ